MMTETISNKTSQLTPQEWTSVLTECADEADKIATHYFQNKSLYISQKNDKTPVSEADIKIEKIIRKYILSKHPDIGVVGEEFDSCEQDVPLKLIVDPIDGTSNFIRGIPIFGTLLAIESNGQIISGLISNGATQERWIGTKGQGSSYNNTPIHVSSIQTIEESQAFYGSLFGNEARGDLDSLLNLLKQTKRQRGIGDYLMHMWVANGYGEFAIDFGLQPWDLAPIGIIIEEAGGTITQIDGSPFSIYKKSILTSNGQFHHKLII